MRPELVLCLSVMSLAASVAAPSLAEAPRFAGSKSTASSASVQAGQGLIRDGNAGTYNQEIFGQPLPQALFGAAALEAAREEGRRYVERRHQAEAAADDVQVEMEPDLNEDAAEEEPRWRWSRSRAARFSDGAQTDMQTYFISR
jgi:hypothetical protein